MSKIYGIKSGETITISGDILEKELNNIYYTIAFDGNIYNIDSIKSQVGIKDSNSVEELLLMLFSKYNEKMLDYINGDFALCISDGDKLFIARDRLGVKPMYYASNINSFVFATDIKDILNSKVVNPIISKEELLEMIALGPAHTPSKTYFKNIFELKAGNYIIYKDNTLSTYKYWDLIEKDNNLKDNEIIENIKELVIDSTKIRLTDNTSSTLSGGLDSTIVTKIASDVNPSIKTFFVLYQIKIY